MKTLLSKGFILVLFVVLGGTALAQTKSIFDISYPISELGNCADRSACKAYCEEPANEALCTTFAREYGIQKPVPQEETKFAVVKTDGGPDGTCGYSKDPIASCRAFCNDAMHIDMCVQYGEKHNLFAKETLKSAQNVRDALKNGAKLPTGCKSKETCKTVCENPASLDIAKQCFTFAEKSGLLPEGAADRAKAEKVFEVIKSGKAPFKSLKEFQQCEKPASEEIFQKCITFGIENGLIPEKEAELLKKTGGRGPGGCFGDACRTYCEDETHEDECYRFAKENNLLPEEDKTRIEEGMVRFKEQIEKAPTEIQTCLKNTVGSEVLDQIAAGTKLPSRDLGNKMRACFEMMREIMPKEMPKGMYPAKPMPYPKQNSVKPQSAINPPSFLSFFEQIFLGK